jgi:hypothetical protein
VTWKTRAACRDFPPERIDAVWFSPKDDYVEAKDVCSRCPVILDCRTAGRHERWGVWGGLAPKDRGVRAEDQGTHGVCHCGNEFAVTKMNRKNCSDICAAKNKQGEARRIAKHNKEKKTA